MVKAAATLHGAAQQKIGAEDRIRELLVAATEGDNHRIEMILSDASVDVNCAGDSHHGNYPALHLASLRGHRRAVEILIARGANVNLQADFDQTPLHLACYNNHAETAAILLRAGANTELKSKAGWTPVFWTCSKSHCPEALVMLMLGGADINASTPEGWTPLHKACEYGLRCMITALLRAGANHEAKTMHGETPLDIALARGHKELGPIFEHVRDLRNQREEERKSMIAAEGNKGKGLLIKLHKTKRLVVEAARKHFLDDRESQCSTCKSDTRRALRDAADVVAERAWHARRTQKRRSLDLGLRRLSLGLGLAGGQEDPSEHASARTS
eukprot:CAMPEP_0202831370 /NCGR_PEP_ID=MMETSP1389-20130828/16810_1 /ASSEMBLY_ACC=CAM_ASM_000865 /TAXON_ID=302021 /ORGANISM="Rhodomonas sp., Strain CCMP768" /LENGTH=328 /DNA_ID=CAMNT_0049505113 /DNA_START=53 /DNA_END=1039 /DNA_ORIENTATION=+